MNKFFLSLSPHSPYSWFSSILIRKSCQTQKEPLESHNKCKYCTKTVELELEIILKLKSSAPHITIILSIIKNHNHENVTRREERGWWWQSSTINSSPYLYNKKIVNVSRTIESFTYKYIAFKNTRISFTAETSHFQTLWNPIFLLSILSLCTEIQK